MLQTNMMILCRLQSAGTNFPVSKISHAVKPVVSVFWHIDLDFACNRVPEILGKILNCCVPQFVWEYFFYESCPVD